MQRVKKGDLVEVISGKDKGHQGKVMQIFLDEQKCLVERAGVVKKHQKAGREGGPSGIVEKSTKIHLAKIMPVDPKTGKRTRVRFIEKDGKRVRVATKSGELIDSLKA